MPRQPPSTGSRKPKPYDRTWDRLAKATRQDAPLCELCLAAGRTVPAVCTDHKRPLAQGGDRLDPRNLQALCQACHDRKTAAENAAPEHRRGPHAARVVILCHPPGAALGEYLARERQLGDAVYSFEALAAALYGIDDRSPEHLRASAAGPLTLARNALIAAALDGRVAGRLWITTSSHDTANELAALADANVVHLATPLDACLDELHRRRLPAASMRAQARMAASWHAMEAARLARKG